MEDVEHFIPILGEQGPGNGQERRGKGKVSGMDKGKGMGKVKG